MPDKPFDPREQGVDRSARPAPLTYEATPESIALAKRVAAEERAEHEKARAAWEVRRLQMVNTLEDLVDEFSYLAVLVELERLQP